MHARHSAGGGSLKKHIQPDAFFFLFHGWLKVGDLSAPLLKIVLGSSVLDRVCGVTALWRVWLGKYLEISYHATTPYRKSAGTREVSLFINLVARTRKRLESENRDYLLINQCDEKAKINL